MKKLKKWKNANENVQKPLGLVTDSWRGVRLFILGIRLRMWAYATLHTAYVTLDRSYACFQKRKEKKRGENRKKKEDEQIEGFTMFPKENFTELVV